MVLRACAVSWAGFDLRDDLELIAVGDGFQEHMICFT
jgi:hypothetical protein